MKKKHVDAKHNLLFLHIMPSVGIYIPDNSELEKKINLRAKKYHDGKVSAYVRKCVEKDLEGASEISPNTSLIDLARQFRPALAPRLERYNLQEQSLILDRLLEAFATALERPNFSANKPFAITNSLEDMKLALMFGAILDAQVAAHNGSKEAALNALANTFAFTPPMMDLIAAEREQAPYTAGLLDSLKKKSATNPAPHIPPPTPPKPKLPESA